MKIDELELSVRTSTLLKSLGLNTLESVLNAEEIVATPLSVLELNALFGELQVEFKGILRSDNSDVEIAEATGDVDQRVGIG